MQAPFYADPFGGGNAWRRAISGISARFIRTEKCLWRVSEALSAPSLRQFFLLRQDILHA